jgi:hypothetical protein
MDRTEVDGSMPRPARFALVLITTVVLSIGGSLPVNAEPITCLPSQSGCGEAAIEKKVQASFGRAVSVFVGQLESIQDSRSGGSATRIFTFKLEKQFKGALAGKSPRISIDSYLTGGQGAAAKSSKKLAEFEQLEAAAESVDTEEAKDLYLKRVTSLREEIKKNGTAEPSVTHVVPLILTAGDRVIRMTDIPMRVGERYAVFVFSKTAFAPDPKQEGSGSSSWIFDPVDLYSMNGERGKRVQAALEQASKAKRK